jgi:hypothetical protein
MARLDRDLPFPAQKEGNPMNLRVLRPILALIVLSAPAAHAEERARPLDEAQIKGFRSPDAVAPGQAFTVRVRVKNKGRSTWTRDLGYALASEPKGNKTWGPARHLLPAGVSVAPNESHTFVLSLTAPQGLGSYPLRWRMLHNKAGRFGDTTPARRVKVAYPFPGADWPSSTPEAQGMSSAKLNAIPTAGLGNVVVIRHGYRVWSQGDIHSETWWASTARSYLTTVFGMLIQDRTLRGGKQAPERAVNRLPSPTARPYPDAVKLKHLLSYTACSSPPGQSWGYSCKWFDTNKIGGDVARVDLATYLNMNLVPVIGGRWRAIIERTDGTLRVLGGPSAMARWGYLWLRQGRWGRQQVLPTWFVKRALSPMPRPDGLGFAHTDEGWQIHLNRSGRPWAGAPTDSFAAIGAAGRGIIFVSPSQDLVVVRSGHVPTNFADEAHDPTHNKVMRAFVVPISKAVVR